jgi:hypothetical protein
MLAKNRGPNPGAEEQHLPFSPDVAAWELRARL